MGFFDKHFIEVRNGAKVTYSQGDLNKLDRMYETEVFERKKKNIRTPFMKEMQSSFQSQVRDYAFERILDRHLYTFSYILVIPNPYGLAKQTALLLFNSSKTTKVRYCVKGNRPEDDFCGETEYTTRHRVPVLGLYQGRNNSVDLQLIDEAGNVIKHRVINIYVSALNEKLNSIIKKPDNNLSHFSFILLNGVFFNPIVIDSAGDIRYALQCNTDKTGMIPLKNGRFLLVDKTANIMNRFGDIQACRYHEMDYMGRVYRTFLMEYQMERAITQNGDSLFIVTASGKQYLADMILEIDMNTGDVISSVSLESLIGNKYKTKGKWANITRIEYFEGKLFIVAKNLHSIIKIDWEEKRTEWIIAPEMVFEGQEAQKQLLKNEDNDIVCSSPEYITVSNVSKDSLEILMFSTENLSKIKNGAEASDTSCVKILRVDERERTFRTVEKTEVDKALRHGSAMYSKDGRRLLAMEGALQDKKNFSSQLVEIDAGTGDKLASIGITKAYNNAWEFEPDIMSYCTSMEKNEKAVFGKIQSPVEYTGELPEVSEERIEKEYFGRVKVCDDILLCAVLPGEIDRIYIVGEKKSYVQNYSDIKPMDKKVFLAISLDEMPDDEYYIYVERDKIAYRLKYEIRIERNK